jgi:hypothetical protein
MIPKSGYRFSEKIMLKEKAKAKFQSTKNHFALASSTRGAKSCATCRFFTGAPAALERALPGLNILSSAYGSVRADTGLCQRHDMFLTARSAACPQFKSSDD